jgi:DNA-binding GntR family transcriptional regulator
MLLEKYMTIVMDIRPKISTGELQQGENFPPSPSSVTYDVSKIR